MPKYCLDEVRAAAKAGKLNYHGRKVTHDAAALEYNFELVCQCLATLTPDEFSKTLKYENSPDFDVYLTSFTHPNQPDNPDQLYIKFALIEDILLASFHLRRF